MSVALRSRSIVLHRPMATATRVPTGAAPSSVDAAPDRSWSAPAGVRPGQARLSAFYRHMTLWTLQGWLALFFAGAAWAKLTETHEILAVLLGWPEAADLTVVRAVGVYEAVLALAIVTPLASWRWFAAPMIGAGVLMALTGVVMASIHLARFEIGFAVLNLIVCATSVAVVIGRLRHPVTAG